MTQREMEDAEARARVIIWHAWWKSTLEDESPLQTLEVSLAQQVQQLAYHCRARGEVIDELSKWFVCERCHAVLERPGLDGILAHGDVCPRTLAEPAK